MCILFFYISTIIGFWQCSKLYRAKMCVLFFFIFPRMFGNLLCSKLYKAKMCVLFLYFLQYFYLYCLFETLWSYNLCFTFSYFLHYLELYAAKTQHCLSRGKEIVILLGTSGCLTRAMQYAELLRGRIWLCLRVYMGVGKGKAVTLQSYGWHMFRCSLE